jgi:hypothetical protein
MSATTTFMHLLIALAGAAVTGYGAQKVGELKQIQVSNDKCLRQTLKKGQTKAALQQSCDKAYNTKGAMMNKVLMYGGCGFIVVTFLIISFMNSGFGMGMGGGQYYQQ